MNEATQADRTNTADAAHHRVCPWYLGYVLANPLRRLVENPARLLGPLVRPGMAVLEPGCGMGFFTLPLARMVGANGRVVAVDLQQKMIDGLRRRAGRAGLLDRIETIACSPSDLGTGSWTARIDLAVAIHVVHEVPDRGAFLRQLYVCLRPGGQLLIVEPKGHVSPQQFAATIEAARDSRFVPGPPPPPFRGLCALLARPAEAA